MMSLTKPDSLPLIMVAMIHWGVMGGITGWTSQLKKRLFWST
jgi:hypothetical protein